MSNKIINKNKTTVADYIAEFLVELNIFNVHGLMGGGAAGLNDGFICNDQINYLCYHHEQSAGYAALGEAKVNQTWSVLNPTTGCGGTNCFTPVLNAWQDSIPLVVISGNVSLDTCSSYLNKKNNIDIRAFGVQEHDVIKSVENITKYSMFLEDETDIENVIVKAFIISASGRKGPSWIDVPADIQHRTIDKFFFDRIPNAIKKIFFEIKKLNSEITIKSKLSHILKALYNSKRPLLLLGGGVANDIDAKIAVEKFVEKTNMVVVATYAGTNIIDYYKNTFLGAIGVKGNRAANFAVQNCDCLIVLGSRLPYAAIGYDVENFAKNAKILVVDPDKNEIKKNEVVMPGRVLQAEGLAQDFLSHVDLQSIFIDSSWLDKCKKMKIDWEIINENKNFYQYEGISIYHVMEELNKSKYDNCNFVLDAGSISYVGPTALKYKKNRNFIFSPAQADMGCALPCALGVAASSKKRTVCVTGDGSLMSNLQELATLSYHNYDLTVILLNNEGYLSISNTQKNNYGSNRVFGEHNGRGLLFPKYKQLCDAFNISYKSIHDIKDLGIFTDKSLKFINVNCLEDETVAPYQAKLNGKQAGAHDMGPFKDKEDLNQLSTVDLKFER